MVVNVYSQYFQAQGVFSEVERHGASVDWAHPLNEARMG